VVTLDAVDAAGGDHVVADILDPEIAGCLPEGLNAVVHLAAVSRDADCARDPRRAIEVNVIGARNVYAAAHARGARQMILASSEWVYGEVAEGPQTEDTPIDLGRIRSEYALTKVMAEQFLRIAKRDLGTTTLTVLRFAIVYGPRPSNWSAVEQLFHAIRSDEEITVRGSLRTARRYVHVADIAGGILSAVRRPLDETFNLSGSALVTLQDIIATSASILQKTPRVTERDPSAITVRDPDNSKARAMLGWAPKLDLRAGLETLVA
jgi:nucleoside-diphosphate-sugar epimerase